jgi:hypothetical protein
MPSGAGSNYVFRASIFSTEFFTEGRMLRVRWFLASDIRATHVNVSHNPANGIMLWASPMSAIIEAEGSVRKSRNATCSLANYSTLKRQVDVSVLDIGKSSFVTSGHATLRPCVQTEE